MKKFFLEHSATLMKSKQTRNFSSKSASANVFMLRRKKKKFCRPPNQPRKQNSVFFIDMKPHESPKLLHYKRRQNYKEIGQTSSPHCQVIALSYVLLLFPTICSRKKKKKKKKT